MLDRMCRKLSVWQTINACHKWMWSMTPKGYKIALMHAYDTAVKDLAILTYKCVKPKPFVIARQIQGNRTNVIYFHLTWAQISGTWNHFVKIGAPKNVFPFFWLSNIGRRSNESIVLQRPYTLDFFSLHFGSHVCCYGKFTDEMRSWTINHLWMFLFIAMLHILMKKYDEPSCPTHSHTIECISNARA